MFKVIKIKYIPCCHQYLFWSISSKVMRSTSFFTSFKYLAPFMLHFFVTGSLSIHTGGSTFPFTITTKQKTLVAPCFLMFAMMNGFSFDHVPTFLLLCGCSRRKYFSSPKMITCGKFGSKFTIPSNQSEKSSLASKSFGSNF